MGYPLLFLFLVAISPIFGEISALYLSWYDDPTTTMTIQWHTSNEESQDTIYLQDSQGEWKTFEGTHHPLEYLFIHQIALQNLTPDTTYLFRIGEDETVHQFQTAPANLERPIRFVIGGDVFQTTKLFRKMNQTVANLNPLFCAIGGDIAYAIKKTPIQLKSTALNRWTDFLKEWQEQMITPEGRIIPFLLAAGNHDLSKENSDLFFSLFAFPEKKLFRAVDFGSYLRLILLDTAHLDPIEGAQTAWLEKTLSEQEQTQYAFAIYHQAAYPSFYPYTGPFPEKIRTHWCPLFEKYHLPVAFEHHNHAFKRTFPIKGEKIDPEGVLYLGDGCWGASPRKTHPMWYLEKRARKNNVYLLELSEKEAIIQAIDIQGDVFDQVNISPKVSRN